MAWFWIVLGIIAYWQIGYQIGRFRRRVYNNAEQYSDVTKRALFPLRGLYGDVGDHNESMLVHRVDCETDSYYCTFLAFTWGILLIPAVVVGFIYLVYGLIEGPNRLFAFFAARHAAARERNETKRRNAATQQKEPSDEDEEDLDEDDDDEDDEDEEDEDYDEDEEYEDDEDDEEDATEDQKRQLEERLESLEARIENHERRLDGQEPPYR
jgi:hypothetical protein